MSFTLDVETTPLVSNDEGRNEIASDFDAILPKNDIDFTLVQSLSSFSGCLKNIVSSLVISLTSTFDADWCAKLPISSIGDCVVCANPGTSICGAFIDKDNSKLMVLRIDNEKRVGRVEHISFSLETSTNLRINHILPVMDKPDRPGIGVYVVLENETNGESFGHSIILSDRLLKKLRDTQEGCCFQKL